MTTTYKKKLIEVAIPLEAINAASAREKSIRHGHPSTLHLWWARRPLAACRAVLFAQLVDDPSSHPDQFPTHEDQERERQRLFAIIEDLVKWENSTNEEVLERARAEIRRSCGGVMPPVYDPFSGGGSIPLEAQRLGLPAYGSDLNPVAVMIGKAMIEIPPKFKDMPPIHPGIKERSFYRNAEGLAEDVKYYGEWMCKKAWERIGHLYPKVDLPKEYGGGQATVIAWIWARTVPSPDPAFSEVQVPLVSSFVLNSKIGQEAWIEPKVDKIRKTIAYSIRVGKDKMAMDAAKKGTKANQATFICLYSGAPIEGDYIDRAAQNGQMQETLIAIVADRKGGKIYLSPDLANGELLAEKVQAASCNFDFSHLSVPTFGTGGGEIFRGRRYSFKTFGDYFLLRQKTALTALSDVVSEVKADIMNRISDAEAGAPGRQFDQSYASAVCLYLSFVVDKCADYNSTICGWISQLGAVRNTFARQAIPMSWEFVEVNLFSGKVGSFDSMLRWVEKCIAELVPESQGSIRQADAQTAEVPKLSVISTDPPYYDNVPYADLSDFFYVWLKRSVGPGFSEELSTISAPKFEELVATPYRHGGKKEAELFFLEGMRKVMFNLARQVRPDFPTTIYYAFKQSEVEKEGVSSTGWATFLQAILDAGFSVVGTWPVRTEFANRMVAVGTNALANSVVLVCRTRTAGAEIVSRAEFIRALKRELPPAITELQAANIAPADMPQSAIGPGMGAFSRYKAVLESDDSPMSVKTALQLINRELDEYLGGIQGEFDPDTRFAITWFEQHGLKAGDYGTANNIATARGISVESVKHAGIVESSAGKVRILSRDELDTDWEPSEDKHLTVWECCHHLVRLHEKHGIGLETAVMLRKIGAKADDVRDLAYVLYNICEKRGDAKEATAYNALIADWTDLTREAASAPLTTRSGQMRFEV